MKYRWHGRDAHVTLFKASKRENRPLHRGLPSVDSYGIQCVPAGTQAGFQRCKISAVATSTLKAPEPAYSPARVLLPLDANRVWSLDVLRAFAIFLVLYGHIPFRIDDHAIAWRFWFILRQMGLIGVDLFFVLSGFLIGKLLLSEHQSTGTLAVGRFYLRRALRLWPSYFVVVLFGWQWYHLVQRFHLMPAGSEEMTTTPARLLNMWPYFAHVQNYVDPGFGAGAVIQTWTLVSIVHFYLIFPILLLISLKLGDGKNGGPIRSLPWIVLAIAIICFGFRYANAPATANQYDPWRNYFPTHLRIDEPMFGVLAAYFVVQFRAAVERAMRYWLVILIASLSALLPTALRREEAPPFLVIWGYTLAALGCTGFVLLAWWAGQRKLATVDRHVSLPVRFWAHVGIWSYSIYLWHQPLAQLMVMKARIRIKLWDSPLHFPIMVFVYLMFSIAIGAAMYYAIEKPALNFRKRITARRSQLRS